MSRCIQVYPFVARNHGGIPFSGVCPFYFSPDEQGGGWGGGYAARLFFCSLSLFSRPRAGLATVKSSFFGLATNTPNVRNNNNSDFFLITYIIAVEFSPTITVNC